MHMQVALQPNAEIHVRLTATFPKTTPRCLVMLNEAPVGTFSEILAFFASPKHSLMFGAVWGQI